MMKSFLYLFVIVVMLSGKNSYASDNTGILIAELLSGNPECGVKYDCNKNYTACVNKIFIKETKKNPLKNIKQLNAFLNEFESLENRKNLGSTFGKKRSVALKMQNKKVKEVLENNPKWEELYGMLLFGIGMAVFSNECTIKK